MGIIRELRASEDPSYRRVHFSPGNYFQIAESSSSGFANTTIKKSAATQLPRQPLLKQQPSPKQPLLKSQRTSSATTLRHQQQQHSPEKPHSFLEAIAKRPTEDEKNGRSFGAILLLVVLFLFLFTLPHWESPSSVNMRKQQQIDRLNGLAEDLTRRWVGRVHCGELRAPAWVWARDGTVIGMPLVFAREELMRTFDKRDGDFSELWGTFVIQLVHEGRGGKLTSMLDRSMRYRMIASSRPPLVSLSCRIRGYSNLLLAVGLSSGLGIVMWYRRLGRLERIRMVTALVEDAERAVYDETEAHARDPVHHPIPGLSTAHLRDHFLPVVVAGRPKGEGKDKAGRRLWYLADETTRKAVWTQVEGVILRNTNVRETGMEVKGEMHRVFIWVGRLGPG
jgi:Man1-Src1p-like protein